MQENSSLVVHHLDMRNEVEFIIGKEGQIRMR